MKTKTKQLFTSMTLAIASTFGVTSASERFNVEPTLEQKLFDQVYESAEFLGQIQTQFVDDIAGQALTLSVNGGVTGRAGVEKDPTKLRKTKDPHGLDKREYRCYPVEADVHLDWVTMDSWSKFPDFASRWRAHVRQAIALDIIKIGWNGTHAADETDIEAFPMMEDVNIGWLQLVRRDKPEHAISDGDQQAGEIRIGEGGDYANLDMAVHDLLQAIPEHKRIGMVAIIGEELQSHEKGKLYAKQAHTPSEKGLIELEQIIDTYGSLRCYKIPFFPQRGILITSFSNLAYYVQSGSVRMGVENNWKGKRVEDYQSRNDCFYIDDLEKIAFFESDAVKIKTPDPANPTELIWS